MYVTTFYSFKGGVGRTMALVNVAVELVLQGKRVVAVDFDLEAPGLDTFDLGRPAETTPGILDFVETYLETDRAPEAEDFLFESPPLGERGGRLWIMPSGSQDERYASRLAALDWQALYEHFDGYLLFEDLKTQWRHALEADYVLIDSRTGHTDVGGICTRQLPDAVALLFFPNQQNLRGLAKVVRDIRAEAKGPRQKRIDLHYVVSNVPDLDDEDEILQGITADFQKQLGFDRKPLAIHRYPSLSLLKQEIFTKGRPRSRLAREYRTLTAEMIRLNPADRDGAIDYIERVRTLRRSRRTARLDADPQLQKIREHHADDGEVLFRLAEIQPPWEDERAIKLFDESIEAGYVAPDVYLSRADRRSRLGDGEGASQDALKVLDSNDVSFPDVYRALGLLGPEDRVRALDSAAFRSLPPGDRLGIAVRSARSSNEATALAAVLERLLRKQELPDGEQRTNARRALVLNLIALKRPVEALESIREETASAAARTINLAFNFSVARWMELGQPDRQAFEQVVVLDRENDQPRSDANYDQCLALAHWAVGNANEARSRAESALRASRRGQPTFSCWRYLEVTPPVFRQDVREMIRMMEGDHSVMPRFLSERPGEQGN